MMSSSIAAMAKALVPNPERCSIIGRIFGNLDTNKSLCVSIQRCCTITSSASCSMNAMGSVKTRYNTLSALNDYPKIVAKIVILWQNNCIIGAFCLSL